MEPPSTTSQLGPGRVGDDWQLLVDSASDAYVSIDDAGHVTRWNVRAADLFGWSREEAVGRPLADLIIPEDLRDAHRLGLRRFVASGRGEVAFQRLQLPALHRSGRRLEVEFTILPVEESGEWRFHSFLRDVTSERAQQRYLRLLEQVALAANQATTVETAIRDSLEAVQELTGSQLAHAYLVEDGPPVSLVPTGWWFPRAVEPLRSTTAGMSFLLGEGLPGGVAQLGEPRWVADVTQDPHFPRAEAATRSGIRAAFAFPVMTGATPVAVIEIFRADPGEPDAHLLDVMRSVGTQLGRVFERQMAMEELRRLAADREAIVAIVGHELRGPLAAAHAATGLLADDPSRPDDEEGGQLLELLDRQIGRLRRLVEMFLTAQRLEAGSLQVRRRPVQLAPLVDEVVADGQFQQVVVQVDDDTTVLGDPDHLAQIVWNLLGNAARHGTPPVTVDAVRGDGRVTLTVTDQGPGVPDELRPKLFERFARGSESQGTGLGLSIVRGLARANDGDVAYAYDPARGSAFTVRLAAG